MESKRKEKFRSYLVKNGWTKSKYKVYGNESFYKRLNSVPNCLCNNKEPSIEIVIYQIYQYVTYSIGIKALTIDNEWIDLNYYSVGLEKFEKKIPLLIKRIKSAWIKINGKNK